jgi:hypothetical protein
MGWLSDIFKTKAKSWYYAQLPAAQTPGSVPVQTIEADQAYINVWLKSMRIVNVRKGLSEFYPTVHSHIELQNISGKASSFNYVTTPNNLEKLDGSRIDKVVNINRRLLGPVPYRGGDIKFEVGLFSIKQADLAEPFIKLLADMSTLGGVSFVSAALPYVKPLEQGIELLTGSQSDTILEIGVVTEFNPVQTGYFVVMRAPANSIKTSELKVDKNDYRLTYKNGEDIEDYPYLVFEISASTNRDEWFNISEVSMAYNALREEVRKGDHTSAGKALQLFNRIVYTSPDLLMKDAEVIIKKVGDDVAKILSAVPTSLESAKISDLPPLEKYEIYK